MATCRQRVFVYFFIPLSLDSELPNPALLLPLSPPWTSVRSERYFAPMLLLGRRDRLARCRLGFFSSP